MEHILIVEDDLAFNKMLETFLRKKGYHVSACSNSEDAIKKLSASTFQVILADVRLPEKEGTVLLEMVRDKKLPTKVILMTGYAEVSKAVEVIKNGAFDYISKPINPEQMLNLIQKAILALKEDSIVKKNSKSPEKPIEESAVEKEASNGYVAGVSEAANKLGDYIKLVAPTDMSVLIIGESGTGKEYVAKRIHEKSKRKGNVFIAVDCGAIPKEIASSEFFGHVKGSFTGAINNKIGHFEAANHGTLFLDEIGNLSYDLQMQLLRALQERKVKPVGSNNEIEVDIRVITATNEDLGKAVELGDFRQDLFHRLNEFSIQVPPLRQRTEDLLLFANYFLDKANEQLGKESLGFSDEALVVLKNYDWPGNLRELQNSVKRSVLLSETREIEKKDLPENIVNHTSKASSYKLFKNQNEEQLILDALEEAGGNKSKAARILDVDRKTLYNKLKHYNIEL
ncbi:sigma-54-dependent transcriptional regulator [Mesonia ostreae]|uniref:Sigma-54 dependent transcriptional regulator n=1 Tax=Mesonia ostreae TaxID=861110 RepID=A0ABU2KKL7_9FLAO|nr:sigma-54 dependent transcriptional regulator [Mesonia ostreae]MDT0295250.1 sigma-54 dependent transcriptional regulator [Mesonia ostreae]